MTRVRALIASSSLLLLAAGCGAPSIAEQPAEQPAVGATPAPFVLGHAHLMPKKGSTPKAFATGPQLNYWGGHVLANVKVYAVFWGSNVDSNVKSQIPQWFTDVTNSRYMDWLEEYDTNISTPNGDPGTNQHIGRGTFAGSVTINPSVTSGTIDDSQIAQEIDSQISAGKLAAPDSNTLYMTFFPPNTQITQGGQSSCQAFCAYHNTFLHGSKSVAYGVIPDFGPGSGCDQGCGFNASAFDNLTSGVSHEMIEAVTDAEIGLVSSSVDGPPMGWYDDQNGEIGDICANQQDGHIGSWTVQTEWSNQRQSCITDDPTVPTPTPTPQPTPTPGTGGGHGHGLAGDLPKVGGCEVASGASAGGWIALAGLFGLTVALRRRR